MNLLLAARMFTQYRGNEIIDMVKAKEMTDLIGLEWLPNASTRTIVLRGATAATVTAYSRTQVIAKIRRMTGGAVNVDSGPRLFVVWYEMGAAITYACLGRDPGQAYRYGSTMANLARMQALSSAAARDEALEPRTTS